MSTPGKNTIHSPAGGRPARSRARLARVAGAVLLVAGAFAVGGVGAASTASAGTDGSPLPGIVRDIGGLVFPNGVRWQ